MPSKTKTRSAQELARETFDLLAKQDLESVQPFWTEDSVDDFVAVGTFRGRDEITGFFRQTFAAFPDFLLEVEQITGDDVFATVQWRATGTFDGGPFLGYEPTGKRVTVRGVDVMEWRDDKLVHNTIYYDGADFARQIGLLPARESTTDRALTASFNAMTKLRTKLRTRQQ